MDFKEMLNKIKNKLIELKDKVVHFFVNSKNKIVEGFANFKEKLKNKKPQQESSKVKTDKKPKYRLKKQAIIPLAIFAALVLYLIISLIIGLVSSKSHKKELEYTFAGLDGKTCYKLICEEDKTNAKEIVDYNFYGDSLNLYFADYDLTMDKSSTLENSKIVLRDISTKEETIFDIGEVKADNQIDLAHLKTGFYSVYLVENETYYRLYMNETLSTAQEVFYATTIDKMNNVVELIANSDYFTLPSQKDDADRDKNNYLYLNVNKVSSDSEEVINVYDVVISTSPARTKDIEALEGEKANGIVEAEEMYDLALDIKTELEAEGLKVLLLKEPYNENIMFYGNYGVLERGYNSKAKYMIHLDMTKDNTTTGVIYSNYVSDKLASSIFTNIRNTTSIFNSDDKCYCCKQVTSSLDNYTVDSDFEIREAGGLILHAGKYSTTSQTNSFAIYNNKGMNTVKIAVCNITKAEQVDNYKAEEINLAKAIAQGIIDYLK